MSNVLIGIIGVILFIGLALAGALILGGDFQTANASSKAAAYVSQAQQVAHAAAMYELKTGKPLEGSPNSEILIPRYLKVKPQGIAITRWDTSHAAAYIKIPRNQTNQEVCTEVQRMAGQIGQNDPWDDRGGTVNAGVVKSPTGCRVHTVDTDLIIWVRF